jgi:hypothetical protein
MSSKTFHDLTAVEDGLVLYSTTLTAEDVEALAGRAWVSHAVAAPPPDAAERAAIALVCRDLQDLRRTVTGLGMCGTATRLLAWFVEPLLRLPVPTLRPEWPRLVDLQAAHGSESYVALRFADPVPARSVFLQLARAGAPDGRSAVQWPTLGVARQQAQLWPVADAAAMVAVPKRLFDLTRADAPDVLTVSSPIDAPAGLSSTQHPVLGRAPTVVTAPEEPSWDECGAARGTEPAMTGPLEDWLRPGALDERVVNPAGFDRAPVGTPLSLEPSDDGGLAVRLRRERHRITDATGRVTDAVIPLLRGLAGIELGWHGTAGPVSYARAVGQLAALGVPLTGDQPPAAVRRFLPPGLAETLGTSRDLLEPLRREELSVRLRRTALSRLGTAAWRRELARRTGSQVVDRATVSVLVTTKRPEMLPFALAQLRRQRGVSFEVVLTTHGFEPSPGHLADWRDVFGSLLQVVVVEPSVLFGAALNRAAEQASGDLLLKMDDDDWYGPDFIGDLLLAREYTGADIVGCSAEFTFVQPLWLTTRNDDDSEVYRPFVAGGTILVDRGAFRAVGGFRHTRKHVDASLLSAVLAAGGNIYRSHGLGYVLRREAQGHTWDPGLAYFVSARRAVDQWRGFRPSEAMDPATCLLPERPQEQH